MPRYHHSPSASPRKKWWLPWLCRSQLAKAQRLVDSGATQVALKEVMEVALQVEVEETTVKASLAAEAMAVAVELVAVAALEVAGSVMVVQGCLGSTHAEALHSVLQSENRVMAAL